MDFDLTQFVKKYQLESKKTYAALKILEKEGILQFNESFHSPSRLFIPFDNKRLYEFQVANANFDIFIKMVLRVYGGELFSHFIPIQESLLAERLSITLEEVNFKLKKLNTLGVFNYLPKKENPQITLLYNGPVQGLPISEKNIQAKKEREQERTTSVIKYVSNTNTCRSVAICIYFGEMEALECGICDICLEKKKALSSLEKSDFCRKAILDIFSTRDKIELVAMPNLLKEFNKDLVINTIRELLDENKLIYQTQHEISLKK